MAAAKPPSPAPITTMSRDEEVAEGMIGEFSKGIVGETEDSRICL
jgi:hypothetical protein